MVIVADGVISNLGKIINLFYNYRDFLGYEKDELIGKKIQTVIPKSIARIHDQIIIDFYKRGKGRLINSERVVFMIHKNKYVFPAEVLLRVLITYSFGIKFVFFVNRNIPIIRNYFSEHYLFDRDLIFYLIYDEKLEVKELSHNIETNFDFSKNVLDQIRGILPPKKKYYISDFFPDLNENRKMKDFEK